MRIESMPSHNKARRARRAFALAAALAITLSCWPQAGLAGGSPPPPPPWQPSGLPVEISPDGFFYLNGRKTVVFGIEEERHIYTREELDQMIPRVKQMGAKFFVVYDSNPQEDFFYERFEQEGLYVAQHLGTFKKQLIAPFPNTGGMIGTLPDEEHIQHLLGEIEQTVSRLSRFRSILFWWVGGEFVEPEFHTPWGIDATRDTVRRLRDAVRANDTLSRPFTVSHHYVEALEDPLLPYIDYSDLTDFTWFTVATHFHLGDFFAGGDWYPVAQVSEWQPILESILWKAYELNSSKPVFFAGMFGQAPLLGPCKAEDQYHLLHDKWNILKNIPQSGNSTYHSVEWNDNAIPHALFERGYHDWIPTPAGRALKEIISASQQ